MDDPDRERAEGADSTEGRVEDAGGSYEVLKNRLEAQGRALGEKTEALNERRKQTFGGTELTVIGNERVRTEHNCIPAEIVSIGDLLLFGYSVRMGLKKTTDVSDVFSLHRFEQTEEGFELSAVPIEQGGDLLRDKNFVRELTELYQYYKDPWLLQLRKTADSKLLAVFRVGEGTSDIKVFRWSLDQDGRAYYIDNRGERDYTFPDSHDFAWVPTTQDDHVRGRHPHIAILDEVFVETIGGDLTIKIEDNTEDGKGIYSEPVQEANQSLDDADISYARVGGLILLKILPYREEEHRYFVFNTRTKNVVRIDAIGKACVQLPEDHGIIFPGGYYLQTGVYKVFEGDMGDLSFQQAVKSPNGEDVLYVFLTRDDGNYVLFPYNLIRKEVQNPIPCHGYTLFPDGKMVVFKQVSEEPTRVHPMQIWQTPFTTPEFAASAPTDGSFLSKVGNAELVRGISDALSVTRLIAEQAPVRHIYEDLIRSCQRMLDTYYWLEHHEIGGLDADLREIRDTAELVIDEFEKIQALRDQAIASLEAARERQQEIIRDLRPEDWRTIEKFMNALRDLRSQRGKLISLRDLRFMDLEAIDELEAETIEQFDRVSAGCVEFLLTDEAFLPLSEQLEDLLGRIGAVEKTTELEPLRDELEQVSDGLTVLSEVASGLQSADPTARTRILEGISEVFAQVNRVRATLEVRRKALMSQEGRAEFAAQFKLLAQSVDSAMARAETPEACDDALSALMLQLEEIEGKFSEFDEFLGQLAEKREEIYEALSAKKQTLVEERQRRAQNLFGAAERILAGVGRRARTFDDQEELNTYFSSDPMLLKLRDVVEKLLALGDSVKADEVESRVKSARQDALRVLRDRSELFEGGENVIKLGRHRFNVNTQPLELTMLPRGDGMAFHLTGTDFYQDVDSEPFLATRDLWEMSIPSENERVYRAEYLAASILFAAEQQRGDLTLEALNEAALAGEDALLDVVRRFAADRYDEGYERGVHDADAVKILTKLLSLRASAGLLRFASTPRALACLFWAFFDDEEQRRRLERRARSLARLRLAFEHSPAVADLANELSELIRARRETTALDAGAGDIRAAGQYLAEELMRGEPPVFTTSGEAWRLRDGLLKHLDATGQRVVFEEDIAAFETRPAEALALARAWVDAYLARSGELEDLSHVAIEAAVSFVTDRRIEREVTSALATVEVEGLLGQHDRIEGGTLRLRLDEFLGRLGEHEAVVVPRYRKYRAERQELIERERRALRLDEFKPRVLTSFVRNKLINEVYLPLIGDNLAKQLGTVGETKRTDLMGMLLLVSPPGYGKTTLMEYLASQLGLVFMKVNGPSLGHDVTSLDPADAPSATARQEVEKINLALEMGNNVMLYLDDIQHTNPELLQKFISLCDAQRRVEGVWKGKTRTYDLRGKKFCMVMAGNPYTESGDRFQIPDMLSNRADTYNLGDVLEGKEDLFALSYIENALTSNPTLAPLASRPQRDLYLLIRMARGEEIPTSELSSAYSGTELADIVAVLKHLFRVQEVLLQVNSQYIRSAAQDDAYRTEPPFQLQGSYRNMTKLAEKIVPAMNEEELQRVIDDHYLGEAQTLTTGAEQNLLKLAEMMGTATDAERERWASICESYRRSKRLGGSETDPAVRVVGQLGDIGEHLRGIGRGLDAMSTMSRLGESLDALRAGLESALARTPEATPAERALATTVEKLDEAIEKLQSPRIELAVDTKVPDPMVDLLAKQVKMVEGVLDLVYSTQQTLNEGGSLSIRLTAVLEEIREIQAGLEALAAVVPSANRPAGRQVATAQEATRRGSLLERAESRRAERARRVDEALRAAKEEEPPSGSES